MEKIFLYLLIINVIAYIVYWFDKKQSRHRHATRVPEFFLILIALIGGSLGARLAMSVFNHKTHHKAFTIGVTLFLFLHIILLGYIWVFYF